MKVIKSIVVIIVILVASYFMGVGLSKISQPSPEDINRIELNAIKILVDSEVIIVKDSIYHFYIDSPEKDITLSKEEIGAIMVLANGRDVIIEKIIVE